MSPRYGKYKDSGAPWLGEVPDHWRVVPLKHLVQIRSGGTPSKENLDYWNGTVPWASAKDLKSELLLDTADHITDDAVANGAATLVSAGSVLVLVRGMMLARAFPVVINAVPMAINQDLKALSPLRDLCSDYLAWVLRGTASESLSRTDEAGHGTKALRMEAWLSMLLPAPPVEEQEAVVTILDRETAKIDALVDEQRRLIELLKEKRQAVISHAVTKGLDPTAPMKDSGVEWLGQVPEHWEVAPLKRHWSVTDCKHLTAEFVDEGIPLASIREVQSQFVDLRNAKQTTEGYYQQLIEGGREPRPGDLIFSRNATVGEVAQVADWHTPFAMGQDVCLLRKMAPDYSTSFLQYVIRSRVVVDQLANVMIGSTFKRVNVEEIRSLIVPTPPAEEQAAIEAFLDDETSRIGSLCSEVERTITLLRERRSALISAAVTGKIDVRGAAPTAAEAA